MSNVNVTCPAAGLPPGVTCSPNPLAINVTGTAAVTGSLTVAVAAFFRRTHLGVAIRAVADDRQVSQLLGIKADTVSNVSWVLGSMLAGMSHMPFWRFQVFSAIGGLLWAALIGIAGYVLGSNLPLLETIIRAVGIGGVTVLLLIALILLVAERRAIRRR